jgi:hypothetical protein
MPDFERLRCSAEAEFLCPGPVHYVPCRGIRQIPHRGNGGQTSGRRELTALDRSDHAGAIMVS